MPDLTIGIERLQDIPHAAYVTLAGAGDARTVPGFQEQMNPLRHAGVIRFAFDIERLKYMNSTFDGYMINLADAVNGDGGIVVLVRMHPKVMVVAEMLGWWTFFRRAESREEALELLRASAGATRAQ